ncbi:MAG: HPP family protein [Nitrospinae bacterium]|nr:HPP family protein [Nitrospinota bacterium]
MAKRPKLKPIPKDHWPDLFVCAASVALISCFVSIGNPAEIVVVTSFASSALAIMVAPDAATNETRSVILSYIIATLASSFAIFLLHNVITVFNNHETIFTFLKFFLLLFVTLFFFGIFDAYHPPSIGATLTYLIQPNLSTTKLFIDVLISLTILLIVIKPYTYYRQQKTLQ